jgi:hypothetical protein
MHVWNLFETLKLRLMSAACHILLGVSSDAIFTVATHASTVGFSSVMLQDQGGGLQPLSYWARIKMSVEIPTLPMIWRLSPFAKRLTIKGVTMKGALSSLS